jgi:excisionase family DNA binding protein
MTLPQAAEHLGVSTRTIRRWIHDGKLSAELRPGPYGKQYLVPVNALPAVRVFPSAVSNQPPDEVAALRRELLDALAASEERQRALLEELIEEIVRLRADVQRLSQLLDLRGTAR